MTVFDLEAGREAEKRDTPTSENDTNTFQIVFFPLKLSAMQLQKTRLLECVTRMRYYISILDKTFKFDLG